MSRYLITLIHLAQYFEAIGSPKLAQTVREIIAAELEH